MAVAVLCTMGALLTSGCGEDAVSDDGPSSSTADGVLAGVVVDPAVRPLAGAKVAIVGPGGGELVQATDGNGSFRFEGLAAGTYAVEASLERHLTAHAIAQVVEGEAFPALVQLTLEVQADELPFVVQVAWEGYIGCAFTYGNLCSAPGQAGYDVVGDSSAHLFFDEYASIGRVPTLIQGEAVWEATTPTSEELKPIYGWSEPVTWQQLSYLGTFFVNSQPSPTFDRVTHEMALEAKIGTENGLVVEFYSGGEDTQPTGLTLNQPVKLFPAQLLRLPAAGRLAVRHRRRATARATRLSADSSKAR
jgi:hypothetical protein